MQQTPEHVLVYYLYHSGFAIVTKNHVLVFDYYRDCPSGGSTTADQILAAAHGRHVVVFVSHSHHDHYTPAIWEWPEKCAAISYVVSNDVPIPEGAAATLAVTVVSARQNYVVGALDVTAYASTDQGVAFLVEADGYRIFHAGDLNWWHWEGEPAADNLAMAASYRREIDALPKEVAIAFIPVDPRLEQAYALGLTYFMSRINAGLIFPMHFADDYSVFAWLRRDLTKEAMERIAEITPSPLPFYLDGSRTLSTNERSTNMNLYEIKVQDMHGNEVALDKYRGKVLLIVNTATECGFTPHYGDLEQLYRQYKDRGLAILDFPSNQFNQAPGTVEEIHAFCTGRFGVTFPLFAKVEVAGENAHPLYKYLTSHTQFAGFDMTHPIGPRLDAKLRAANPDYHLHPDIKWNFTKFLIGRDGSIVGRYEPTFDMAILRSIIDGVL